MHNVLLVYHNRHSFPLRKTTDDYIYSFKNHSPDRYFFLNAAFTPPGYIKKVPFDLVIFHSTFISDLKWCDLGYDDWSKNFEKFKNLKGDKIVLCQDEFLKTEQVCQFIQDFNVSKVFSVAPKTEWNKIYPIPVFVQKILTGYLEEGDIEKIGDLAKKYPTRDIDIGYRSWKAEPWVGRHGMLKTHIAEKFLEASPQFGLKTDISMWPEDTFFGLDWYRFLLRCKYTIGVEGGSSILDKDGSIKKKVFEFIQKEPKASFDEVEKACFSGLDGNLKLFAISPRHLEAIVTKTCQILIEGEYDGILKPNLHYIELKRDFSNLEEVLKIVKEDKLREEIVERAYEDIVKSGKYRYQNFVSTVINESLPTHKKQSENQSVKALFFINNLREGMLWSRIAVLSFTKKILKTVLSKNTVNWLRRLTKKISFYRS